MKILRAEKDKQIFYAELQGNSVKCISGLPYDGIVYTGVEYNLCDVRILTPSQPSKIVAVGLNYAKHAGEMKEELKKTPIILLKPPTSAIAQGEGIVYPKASARVDFEAELGVVIKKTCKDVAARDAMDYVFGLTAAQTM